jgi:hypothetical protein
MEFTARALSLQHEAIRLSQQISGDHAELNRWWQSPSRRA